MEKSESHHLERTSLFCRNNQSVLTTETTWKLGPCIYIYTLQIYIYMHIYVLLNLCICITGYIFGPKKKIYTYIYIYILAGFNPFERYESDWILSPSRALKKRNHHLDIRSTHIQNRKGSESCSTFYQGIELPSNSKP